MTFTCILYSRGELRFFLDTYRLAGSIFVGSKFLILIFIVVVFLEKWLFFRGMEIFVDIFWGHF